MAYRAAQSENSERQRSHLGAPSKGSRPVERLAARAGQVGGARHNQDMTVKRAHMVSRGYLRAWANPRDLVHVWDSENRISRTQPVGNATVVNFAYRTEVANLDLEAEFGRIESNALPAIRSLADGGAPNRDGRAAIIDFLDMHLERGRFADQAKVRVPVIKGSFTGGEPEAIGMGLGDRITFSRDVDLDAIRLRKLNLERWRWRVYEMNNGLVTGDGAVLMFNHRPAHEPDAVTFPLSPTRLLVLGDVFGPPSDNINLLVIEHSRRWIVDRVEGRFTQALAFN